MVIFHSYVSLPEGNNLFFLLDGLFRGNGGNTWGIDVVDGIDDGFYRCFIPFLRETHTLW